MAESSTASLPYVAVARKHLIQAQVHAADGNAGLIAASILQRRARGAAHSFAYDDGHTFHFSGDAAAGGVVFLCAEKGLGAGPAFAFLERCRRRYEQTQSEALPLKSFLKRFEGELAELRSAAEADGGDGAGLEQIEGKLQGIKQVMKESVEKVLDRGERIELLIDRTDHLQHNAFRFAQGSTALKRSLRWRSLRCYLMLGGAACFLAGLLILVGCGSFDVQECTRGSRGASARLRGRVDPRDGTERLTPGASDFFVLSKMSLYHRGDEIAHLPAHARLQAALEPPLGAALRVLRRRKSRAHRCPTRRARS